MFVRDLKIWRWQWKKVVVLAKISVAEFWAAFDDINTRLVTGLTTLVFRACLCVVKQEAIKSCDRIPAECEAQTD
jgi:hypothetical protein